MIGMRHYTTQEAKHGTTNWLHTKRNSSVSFPNELAQIPARSANESVLKFMHHHLEDAKINQGQVNAKRGVI